MASSVSPWQGASRGLPGPPGPWGEAEPFPVCWVSPRASSSRSLAVVPRTAAGRVIYAPRGTPPCPLGGPGAVCGGPEMLGAGAEAAAREEQGKVRESSPRDAALAAAGHGSLGSAGGTGVAPRSASPDGSSEGRRPLPLGAFTGAGWAVPSDVSSFSPLPVGDRRLPAAPQSPPAGLPLFPRPC